MVFERVQIGNSIFDELWSEKRARVVPELAVGCED